jgi:hypothetical protein
MHLTRKIGRFIILLSLPAVMFLFHNQLANWHYHLLDNGMVVEHSHPYSKPKSGSPFQQHSHSDLEYTILAQLSNILPLLVLLFFLAFTFESLKNAIGQKPLRIFFYSSYLSCNPLRGPPALI